MTWKAPEVLRNNSGGLGGSSKADVYSFSLILYTIHTRDKPWKKTNLTSQGIILELPQRFV